MSYCGVEFVPDGSDVGVGSVLGQFLCDWFSHLNAHLLTDLPIHLEIPHSVVLVSMEIDQQPALEINLQNHI